MAVVRFRNGAKIKSVTTVHADGRRERVDHNPPSSVVHPQPARRIGLGDLVGRFAQPIAAVVDTITESMLREEHKTALQKCPACNRRHTKLNLLCPDVLTCPFLGKLLDLLPTPARKSLLEAAQKHTKPHDSSNLDL